MKKQDLREIFLSNESLLLELDPGAPRLSLHYLEQAIALVKGTSYEKHLKKAQEVFDEIREATLRTHRTRLMNQLYGGTVYGWYICSCGMISSLEERSEVVMLGGDERAARDEAERLAEVHAKKHRETAKR